MTEQTNLALQTTQPLEVPTPPAFVDWPAEPAWSSIPERFEEMVRLYPQRLALSGEGRSLSYEQLNRLANRLARAMLAQLGQGPEPVALLLEHGVDIIIALVAALKAGKSYVPLDPAYPLPRIEAILADGGIRLTITNSLNQAKASQLKSPFAPLLMETVEPGLSDENLNLSIAPDSYLNIIYTSGSTGQPKGVAQTHQNVLFDTKASTQLLKINPADRFGLIVPCTFGASISDICGPLLNGGSVFPFDIKRGGLERMARWCKESRITVIHAVPTVFRQWLAVVAEDEVYPEMRVVKVGGESLLKHDFELFKQHFTDTCILRNALGSTEAYMVACYMLDRNSEAPETVIPVGYATAGREILILDEQDRPLPVGETGQIIIKSRYLSPGYWQQPELSAKTFRPSLDGDETRLYFTGDLGRLRPDGCLEHLGRKDEMVKIRGQRVEVAEIELALLASGLAQEAVVVAQKRAEGEERLVAYLVPKIQPGPNVSSLRTMLALQLPDAMIPAAFVMMERFPLLPFGKVDRRALPLPDASRPNLSVPYEAPQTQTQATLARLFAEVLKLDRVGIQDNFFELGGDSLLATQLVTRIQAEFGVEVPVVSLFETSTVAGLNQLILQRQAASLEGGELEQLLSELEGLSEEEVQRLLDLES